MRVGRGQLGAHLRRADATAPLLLDDGQAHRRQQPRRLGPAVACPFALSLSPAARAATVPCIRRATPALRLGASAHAGLAPIIARRPPVRKPMPACQSPWMSTAQYVAWRPSAGRVPAGRRKRHAWWPGS